mmetsp:Transcript_84686/g.226374  ORF Transcript_84686/g.226374 Transcript_84686/m.226374 type:complete len:250 (-) Transcript_84686:52-801(-)
MPSVLRVAQSLSCDVGGVLLGVGHLQNVVLYHPSQRGQEPQRDLVRQHQALDQEQAVVGGQLEPIPTVVHLPALQDAPADLLLQLLCLRVLDGLALPVLLLEELVHPPLENQVPLQLPESEVVAPAVVHVLDDAEEDEGPEHSQGDGGLRGVGQADVLGHILHLLLGVVEVVVVGLAHLRIRQDLIGLGDLAKLLLRIFPGVAIRMVLQSQRTVDLLHFLLGDGSRHAHDVVAVVLAAVHLHLSQARHP